jgi:hypothetical protein
VGGGLPGGGSGVAEGALQQPLVADLMVAE